MKAWSPLRRLCAWALALALCLTPAAALPGQAEEAPDMDLSCLSTTMMYSQLFNILMDAEAWEGKIIRMTGQFSVWDDADLGGLHFTCVVADATACCFQGLDFVWAGNHPYPDAYPPEGALITVTGRFELYEEDGYSFVRLADAQVEWE